MLKYGYDIRLSKVAAEAVHKIVQGDTLYALAKKYGVSLDDLQKANPNLNPKKLKLGANVIIPVVKPTVTATQSPAVTPTQPTSTNRTHTISRGDTLDALSKKYNVSVKRLQAANPKLVPTRLQIGTQVNIPIEDWQDIHNRTGFDPRVYTPISDDLRQRIRIVESSNGKNLYNAESGATGPYQTRQIAFNEAQKLNPAFKGWTLKDMMDENKSRQVMDTLHKKWSRDYQFTHEKPFTDDVFVRMWNQGPVGWNKPENRKEADKYSRKIWAAELPKK